MQMPPILTGGICSSILDFILFHQHKLLGIDIVVGYNFGNKKAPKIGGLKLLGGSLLDSGGLSHPTPQVVELGPTDMPFL